MRRLFTFNHTVHITRPGTYRLIGTLSAGQVAVDLGEDAKDDSAARVTLILDGVNLNCTVAPAVIFYNVYEPCDTDEETAAYLVDTSGAGANVILADGSVNNISGSYVARIYKPGSVVLSEDGTEVTDSKKLHKYDAAFYSKMTMNIDGNDGVLNINAENKGLDSELHLTINGGVINITSGNDGINTNEDGVSVTTINGGTVCASGSMLDTIAGGNATYAVFAFAQRQSGGFGGRMPQDGRRPEDKERPSDRELPEGMEPPADERPEDGRWGRPNGGGASETGEVSTIFTIVQGGNYFSAAAPA